MVTESKILLCPTSFIKPPQSAVGNIFGPLFVKSLGPSLWSKNSLVSSNTCQVIWAHLTWVSLDLTAFREGWFNTLLNWNTWSYKGHTYQNNTHQNTANVSNISFSSYQFIWGRLGSVLHLQWLILSLSVLEFSICLFPPNLFLNFLCSPWYHYQWRSTTLCSLLHCNRSP